MKIPFAPVNRAVSTDPLLAAENVRLHDAWMAEHMACYGEDGCEHEAAIQLEETAWNTWLDFCLANRLPEPGAQTGLITAENSLSEIPNPLPAA